MEHNRGCDTIGEVDGNSKFADFALNVDKNWRKNSSQGNLYNGINISSQKNTQIAEFSVVTPEQSKHNKPVDLAFFSKILHGDPGLTAYLNELLRTYKPEEKNNISGSQNLKLLGSLRITPQYTRESSKN